jgi:hypothetical protein
MENINIGGTDEDWETYYILSWLEENGQDLVKMIDEEEKQSQTHSHIRDFK